MSLVTERLILRDWRDADREPFARLNDDPAVMEFMPSRLTRDESDASVARTRASFEARGWGWWAVEIKPSTKQPTTRVPFIGYVGLSVPRFEAHFTPCVEVGWRLAKEYWGYGYASEAATACLRFGFEKLTLEQIVAFTVPLNKRSIRVMEKIGMTRDAADDFDHPNLAPGHPLRRHVLYKITRASAAGADVAAAQREP